MTTAQVREQRRRQHAPDGPPVIVSGRSFTFFWGRNDAGGHTFSLSTRRIGDTAADNGRSRGPSSAKGSPGRLAGRAERRGRRNGEERGTGRNRVRNPRQSQARAARLTIAKVARGAAAAAAKPFRSAWSGIRHLRTAVRPRNERERNEFKKFMVIGRVGLVSGIVGTAVGLATHNANIGMVTANVVAYSTMSRVQGYVSMLLDRKLAESSPQIDDRQDKQLKAITRRVERLEKGGGATKTGRTSPGTTPKAKKQEGRKAQPGKRQASERGASGKSGQRGTRKPPAKGGQQRTPGDGRAH